MFQRKTCKVEKLFFSWIRLNHFCPRISPNSLMWIYLWTLVWTGWITLAFGCQFPVYKLEDLGEKWIRCPAKCPSQFWTSFTHRWQDVNFRRDWSWGAGEPLFHSIEKAGHFFGVAWELIEDRSPILSPDLDGNDSPAWSPGEKRKRMERLP